MAQVTLSNLDRVRLPTECPMCGDTTVPYNALQGVFCASCNWVRVVPWHNPNNTGCLIADSTWHR